MRQPRACHLRKGDTCDEQNSLPGVRRLDAEHQRRPPSFLDHPDSGHSGCVAWTSGSQPVLVYLHDRGEIRAAARQSKAVTVQRALMEIVAAPVVDSDSELFIGTGDGSNGSWVRP